MRWEDLRAGTRVELGFLQVDIAGHSRLQESDRVLHRAKAMFHQLIQGAVTTRGGKTLNWAGDGGCFMFLTGEGEGFEDLVFAGLQILNTLPLINEEIAVKSQLGDMISLRISGDAGNVVYDPDPGRISGDALNKFVKAERQIGLANTFSVTARVWGQLPKSLKERFCLFKYDPLVEDKIYNYGARQLQVDILSSLRNVTHSDEGEKPYPEPQCVEVSALEGDTLAGISRHAYRDVILDRFQNVGGFNLLVTKNAQICMVEVQPDEDQVRDLTFSDIAREFEDIGYNRTKVQKVA